MTSREKGCITKEGENLKYSESTLQSWTAPLSKSEQDRAENTVKMIKFAIDANAELKTMDIEVFAQGSFANNTNVRIESDVDICVMLRSTFFYDLPEGKVAADYGITPGSITFQRYRNLVKKALQDKFGSSYVTDGNKSLRIRENTYHVQADVVPAFQYRRYTITVGSYHEGIQFYAKDGKQVTNFPKVHIKNGTAKNNRTWYKYKELVRIMKHIKNDMVDDGMTNGDKITSFLVECLVWNISDATITGYSSWTETVKQAIKYLYNAIEDDKHKEWGEVSELLYLFHNGRKWTEQDAMQWLYDVWNYLGYST